MADVPFATNLLPQYQSPQQMAQMAATTQQTQAQTGLIGAQTQAANIQNQGSQLSLGALQQAYSGGALLNGPGAPNGASAGSSGASVGGFDIDPDDIALGMQRNYAPLPTAPPPALRQQAYLLSLGGKPEAAKAVLDNFASQVQGQNQQRVIAADSVYKMAQTVDGSGPGTAFETFQRYDPGKAAAFKAQHSSDDPQELDADTRLLAQHSGIGVHQYTGRPIHFDNGVMVDDKDGKPVLGSKQILTGLNSEAKGSKFDEANAPITLGDQLPKPRWQVTIDPSTGRPFTSAESYVIAADKAARSSATTAAGAPNGPPAPPGNTSATVAPPQPKAGAATTVADPVEKTALADTSYRLQPLPRPTNQSELAANTDQAKANIAAKQNLKTESDQSTAAAAQAQTYLQAAKSIIDSNGATVGAYGGLMAKASALIGDYKGDASNYQELTKYLNNAAIAAAKGNYGSGLTEKELELQLSGASPSVDKSPGALSNLVNSNLRNTQYTLDTAGRAVRYLNAGNDPANFKKYNQQYWNQSSAVNKPTAAPSAGATEGAKSMSKSGKPIVFQGGHWQYAQ